MFYEKPMPSGLKISSPSIGSTAVSDYILESKIIRLLDNNEDAISAIMKPNFKNSFKVGDELHSIVYKMSTAELATLLNIYADEGIKGVIKQILKRNNNNKPKNGTI